MKKPLFVLILVLQSLFLIGASAWNELALRKGKTILLETMPVDPRDLLRGDYVILNYKISNIPRAMLGFQEGGSIPTGMKVYVILEKQGQFHQIKTASLERLEPKSNQILLVGQSDSPPTGTSRIHVKYGLESYFVREGTGHPRGKLTVEAAVTSSGVGRIKQVFIDGKPYAEVMRTQ